MATEAPSLDLKVIIKINFIITVTELILVHFVRNNLDNFQIAKDSVALNIYEDNAKKQSLFGEPKLALH